VKTKLKTSGVVTQHRRKHKAGKLVW